MSQGVACKETTHRAGGYWVVVTRNGNHSAFNGGRFTPSDYSLVRCLECGAMWRTKAAFVRTLRNATTEQATQA